MAGKRRSRALVVALAWSWAACGDEPSGSFGPLEGCTISGGTVTTVLCCGMTSDFPNLCVSGACGCSTPDSVPRKICDCPGGSCFDGARCVTR